MNNLVFPFRTIAIASGYDVLFFFGIFTIMRQYFLKRDNLRKWLFGALLWIFIVLISSILSNLLDGDRNGYDYWLSFKLEFSASLICCGIALFGIDFSFNYHSWSRKILLFTLLCIVLSIRVFWGLMNFFQYCNLRVCHFTNYP
jgi:hypothetical protein